MDTPIVEYVRGLDCRWNCAGVEHAKHRQHERLLAVCEEDEVRLRQPPIGAAGPFLI